MPVINKEKFWARPVYLPYVQEELTPAKIKEVETRFNCKLPESYIELLYEQNGGYVRYTKPEDEGGALDVLYGIGTHFPNIVDQTIMMREAYPGEFDSHNLVALDGDGHQFICLDYRLDKDKPSVTWVVFDTPTEYFLAKSFDDYLKNWCVDEGFFGLIVQKEDTESNIDLQELEKLLGRKLVDQGSDHSGYNVFSSKDGNVSIDFHFNEIPGGFVRASNARYQELKHIDLENALFFHELPENAGILSIWPLEEQEKVSKNLEKSGYKTVSISEFYENFRISFSDI